MRVIAGIYRSRPLAAPRGLAIRPTSDRLRETLFNVLAARIEGAAFADLYAGSGAVGIEALSRGASLVHFVDNAPAAAAAVRANLASLRIESGFRIQREAVSATLRCLAERPMPAPFDVIFLDPPYEAVGAYASTLGILGRNTAPLLAGDGIVIAEHRRATPQPLAAGYGILRRYRLLEQGDAALSFYRMAERE